jgi:hypothetical protein
MNHLENGTIAVGAPGSEMRKLAEAEDTAKAPKQVEKVLSGNLLTAKQVEKVLPGNLLTAKQVVIVYSFAGMTKDMLPKKSTATILTPVGNVYFRITKSEFKSTYGERLFRVEQIQSGVKR